MSDGDATTVWLDGTIIDPGRPAIDVLDHGLTVGDGVFETMRTERGEAFALTRHLRRLRASLAGLGIVLDRSDDELRAAVADTLRAYGGEARVRLTVTSGPGPPGSQRGVATPTVIVVATPPMVRPAITDVCTVAWRRNEHSPIAGLKTTSYAENVVALAGATEVGATEALMANTAGDLCEGTGSNVFVVIDDRVLTPPLSSGCLAGITRELVLEIATAEEVDLPFVVLDDAEEVFLTSSTRDVQAVATIDGRRIGDGRTGSRTARIANAFAELAARTTDP